MEIINQVICQPIIKAFDTYKQDFADVRDIDFADEFNISAQAVKTTTDF